MRVTSTDRVETVIAMVGQGASDQQIADALGVCSRTILRLRTAHGIRPGITLRQPEHGTANTYRAGCRCQECRDANTEMHRKLRAQRRLTPEAVPHGTPSGYKNWGCRCEECRMANTAAEGTARLQETLPTADRRHASWTAAELAVAARTDLTAGEVALRIGRTYAAVTAARRALKREVTP